MPACACFGAKPGPPPPEQRARPQDPDEGPAYADEEQQQQRQQAAAAERRRAAAKLRRNRAGNVERPLEPDLRRDLPTLRAAARVALTSYCAQDELEVRPLKKRPGARALAMAPLWLGVSHRGKAARRPVWQLAAGAAMRTRFRTLGRPQAPCGGGLPRPREGGWSQAACAPSVPRLTIRSRVCRSASTTRRAPARMLSRATSPF